MPIALERKGLLLVLCYSNHSQSIVSKGGLFRNDFGHMVNIKRSIDRANMIRCGFTSVWTRIYYSQNGVETVPILFWSFPDGSNMCLSFAKCFWSRVNTNLEISSTVVTRIYHSQTTRTRPGRKASLLLVNASQERYTESRSSARS